MKTDVLFYLETLLGDSGRQTKLVTENGGWKHHLLTEDVEFSVDSVIKGQKIGYCSVCKFVCFHCISISKPDDLCCPVFYFLNCIMLM